MQQKTVDYIKEINFEQVEASQLTGDKLNSLEAKNGFVVETDTTDLYINRSLSLFNVLGTATVMESTTNFIIMDSFGMIIWEGDTESIVEYVNGFLDEDFEI